jgi:sulfocyanin SoxE-like protein
MRAICSMTMSRGFTVIALTLAAAAPLRAAQVGDTVRAHPPSAGSADSGSGRGAHHHHHHGGGKHAAGGKRLSFDALTNTVTFELVAGRAHGPSRLNFNGHGNGKATLVVPPRSHVVMPFVNEDSIPHSAAVIVDREPMPAHPTPAIPQAATRELMRGLPPHAADTLRFTVPASGTYRSVSGVPGQARAGMWIRLRVEPSARAPSWEKGA